MFKTIPLNSSFFRKKREERPLFLEYDKEKNQFYTFIGEDKVYIEPDLIPTKVFYSALDGKKPEIIVYGSRREIEVIGSEKWIKFSPSSSIIKIENAYKKDVILDIFFHICGRKKGHQFYVVDKENGRVLDIYIEVPLFFDNNIEDLEQFVLRF